MVHGDLGLQQRPRARQPLTSATPPIAARAPACTDGEGNWGLGYADNPINPAYPPDRPNFPSASSNPTPTGSTYSPNWDMSHPQYWPYQEKVIGWAFDSIALWDYSQGKDVQAFAYAPGNSAVATYRHLLRPRGGRTDLRQHPRRQLRRQQRQLHLGHRPGLLPAHREHLRRSLLVALARVGEPPVITHGENPGCVVHTDCGSG